MIHTEYKKNTFKVHADYIQHTYNLYNIQLEEYHECLQSNDWLVAHFRPVQGPGVDVPPCAAVSTVILRVSGSPREGTPFLAHGIRNRSSFSHLHYRYSAQNQCDWGDIKYLRLHFTLINDG